MFRLNSRFGQSAFCEWHECPGCEPLYGPDDREAAVTWLRALPVGESQLKDLCASAEYAGITLDASSKGGASVTDQLAALLRSGRVRVCGQCTVEDASATQELLRDRGGTGTGFDRLLPERTPSRARPSPPPSPEQGTLPGVDPGAMAEALLGAAAAGSPFVEICARDAAPAPARADLAT